MVRVASCRSGSASRMRTSNPAAPRIRHSVSTEGDRRPDSYAEIAAWLVLARLASSTWVRPALRLAIRIRCREYVSVATPQIYRYRCIFGGNRAGDHRLEHHDGLPPNGEGTGGADG